MKKNKGSRSLEERIERLEHSNRTLRRTALALTVGILPILLMAQSKAPSPQRAVEAQSFVLVDSTGKKRAMLGSVADTGEADRYGLFVYDTHDRQRGELCVSDSTDRIALTLGDAEHYGVEISTEGQWAEVEVYGPAGEVSLQTSPSFASMTVLRDRIQKMRQKKGPISRPTSIEEVLPLADKLMKAMALTMGVVEGAPFLSMMHSDAAAERLRCEVTKEGLPAITLKDGAGKPRTTIGCIDLQTETTGSIEKRPASSVVLFGPDGKSFWRIPW